MNNKGFSLIEVLIVLAIIGIFSFIAVPRFMRIISTAKLKATEVELQHLRTALNSYFSEFSKYPPSLQELVNEKFMGKECLTDGWNIPYTYKTFPDSSNNLLQKYILSSAGKDKIAGNDDDIKISSE